MRGFVGGGDAGEVGDFAFARALVESFGVALLADGEGAVAVDFNEVFGVVYYFAHALAVGAEGGDEGGEGDDAAFYE